MTAKEMPSTMPGTDTLVDSIRSEVSAEASPLMNFLLNNARLIVVGLVVFIAAIGAYWVFTHQAGKQAQEEARALGRVLVIADPQTRLEKLEAFIETAPASVKNTARFALMAAATETGNHEKAYKAWEGIGQQDESIRSVSVMGMTGALINQGKVKEALALLEKSLSSMSKADQINAQSRIVFLAELAGDIPKAIAACDVLIAAPEQVGEVQLWAQKKIALQQLVPAAASDAAPAASDAAAQGGKE